MIANKGRGGALAALTAAAVCSGAAAQTPPEPPLILVQATAEASADTLAFARVSSSDTAVLLPGADAARREAPYRARSCRYPHRDARWMPQSP